MNRTRYLALGLVLATAIAFALSAVDDPAYQTLGRLAVQQQGRRKPFDTLAREAVKQIHGAPSVKRAGPAGNTIATWPAVAALLDWSVRPHRGEARARTRLTPRSGAPSRAAPRSAPRRPPRRPDTAAQDGHAGQAQRPSAVDEHPARRRRRVAHDGVEGHREGIGQHGGLVGDAVRHGDQHGIVRRQSLGPGPGAP